MSDNKEIKTAEDRKERDAKIGKAKTILSRIFILHEGGHSATDQILDKATDAMYEYLDKLK